MIGKMVHLGSDLERYLSGANGYWGYRVNRIVMSASHLAVTISMHWRQLEWSSPRGFILLIYKSEVLRLAVRNVSFPLLCILGDIGITFSLEAIQGTFFGSIRSLRLGSTRGHAASPRMEVFARGLVVVIVVFLSSDAEGIASVLAKGPPRRVEREWRTQ